MIVHVWRRAVAAELGPVVVACGDRAIADAVEAAGGRAVMTDPSLPTGSDRIHEAIAQLDPEREHDAVINVQGDLPLLDPAAIRVAVDGLADPETDIATLAAVIDGRQPRSTDTSVNKVVAGFADPTRPAARSLFRKAVVPWGDGAALRAYRALRLSPRRRSSALSDCRAACLKQRERLEQLRALEAGMTHLGQPDRRRRGSGSRSTPRPISSAPARWSQDDASMAAPTATSPSRARPAPIPTSPAGMFSPR